MLEEQPLSDALTRFKLLEDVKSRSSEEPIEWETAYAIWEIVRSLRKIDRDLIPSILSASKRDEAEQALHEIREELRHVLYHIEDSTYISVITSS